MTDLARQFSFFTSQTRLTVANTVDIFVGEDTAFMIVSPVTCLFNDSGRKTMSISLVVSKLRVNKVVNLKFPLSYAVTFRVITKNTHVPLESFDKRISGENI